MRRAIRIANASGFYGDRFTAMEEQIRGGDIDVITGDYLAELTMFILWKTRQREGGAGFAISFLKQMEPLLGECVDRGIRVVTNAGGLDPSGLASALRALASELRIDISVAHIEGDDLMPSMEDLTERGQRFANMDTGADLATIDAPPITANTYLGGWGIVEALDAGAGIVVCPRVTDASLVVAPAAWHHGWGRTDWDRLAGAVVAGHVLECGAQATGGNFSFFTEIEDLLEPGFPIAEIAGDGSSVITKHEGTGGAVTVETVKAQILYEIDTPAYRNPDVVTHFDTIDLAQVGDNRVAISGVEGSPPPNTLKVAINYAGGFRNSVTLGIVGLDTSRKAELVERSIRHRLSAEAPEVLVFDLIRTGVRDADSNATAASMLTITATDIDARKVGRAFSSAIIELALASYPGFFATAPPSRGSMFGVYWPTTVDRTDVVHEVVFDDGSRVEITDPPTSDDGLAPRAQVSRDVTPWGETRSAPIGAVFGARSGDKGGNANLGLWAPDETSYLWLAEILTVGMLKRLLPEVDELDVDRHDLPNIYGINFVIHGLLGRGVASSTRFDPQAKSLAEWLRSRYIDIPEDLLVHDRRHGDH